MICCAQRKEWYHAVTNNIYKIIFNKSSVYSVLKGKHFNRKFSQSLHIRVLYQRGQIKMGNMILSHYLADQPHLDIKL